MSKFFYDLHIHSCLSPCGDDDNTPNNIAGMASLCELDIVALTDHNTVKNCPAFFEAAKKYGIIPVAGMELTTSEDIHVVCIFEKLDDAYLRRYEAEITNALLGINAFNQVAHQLRHDSNTVKMRARKIWNYLKSEISSNKRIRHFVAQRILKRWLYLVTDTARYIYGYFTDSGLAEQAFKKVIVDIFRPEDGEDGYFVSVWVNIADSLDMMDDGMDDLSDFY